MKCLFTIALDDSVAILMGTEFAGLYRNYLLETILTFVPMWYEFGLLSPSLGDSSVLLLLCYSSAEMLYYMDILFHGSGLLQ